MPQITHKLPSEANYFSHHNICRNALLNKGTKFYRKFCFEYNHCDCSKSDEILIAIFGPILNHAFKIKKFARKICINNKKLEKKFLL